MAITVTTRTEIIELVVGMFNAPPGASVLSELVSALGRGTIKQLGANLEGAVFNGIYPTFLTNQEFADRLINNLVGTEVAAADKASAATLIVAQLAGGASRSSVIVDAINTLKAVASTNTAWINGATAFNNKVSVATYYTVDKQLSASTLAGLQSIIASVTSSAASVNTAKASVDSTGSAGLPFTLTTSANVLNGTAGDDTFDGSVSATFSNFDVLDGAGGSADTLNAVLAAGTLPAGAVVKNIEIANINTTNGGLVADVSGYSGLLKATFGVGAAGTATITGAATTDLTTSFVSGSSTVNGGKNIVVQAAALGNAETLSVGATTAAVGDISITAASATGAGVGTIAATTKGGTTVSIKDTNPTATNAQRAMNVTDGAATATVAGTLKSVKLDGYGANSTVSSNALTDLTLANSITGLTVNVTNTSTAAAASKTSALNLTLSNVTSTTLVDTNAEIGTLNITVAGSATQNSTLAAITDANLTALNVTGAAANKLTLAAATGLAGLKTISVSGATSFTAGVDVSAVATGLTGVTASGTGTVTLGATTVTQGISTTATYVGGAGNDVLSIGATKQAIDLGDGTNTLYMLAGTTALGTGGSVKSGAGTADVLGMAVADAVTASASATFATKVTGFERLTLGAASANPQVVDVAALLGATNASYVTTTGVATNVLNLANLNTSGTGATVIINNASAVTNAGVTLSGAAGSAGTDVLNLNLKDTAATGTVVAFGTVTAENVETVKIDISDSRTTTVPNQAINTVTLTDTALQVLTVKGNQSLNLTHTAGTALTSVDASGMTLGGLTFTSNANQYATTVIGSAKGGDVLSFAAATASVTITETAGTNSITGSATIASTLTGGTGLDTIVGGAGKDTIVAGAGTTGNTITGAGAADTINLTGSTGADTIRYNTIATSAAANGSQVDVITGFTAGTDKINFAQGAASLTGVTTDGNGDAVATMAAAVANTTSVATIAEVYTALAAYTTLTASNANGTATVAQVYTFANGAAAGTYLVVNDATAGFQAANDVVIQLVGLTGTIAAADFTFTA